MRFFIKLIISTVAVLVSTSILPGASVDSLKTAIILAIVLGALNAFLKPLLHVLTLPITVLTLGLFSLVINTFLVLLAEYIVPGFAISSLATAFLFSVVLSIMNWFLSSWTD